MLSELDNLLVEITDFCQLMVQYQSEEFIFRELLGVSKFLDFQDEAGKVNIMKLYRELCFLPPSLTQGRDSQGLGGECLVAGHFFLLRWC